MIKALLSLIVPCGSVLILSACQPDIPETIQQGMVYLPRAHQRALTRNGSPQALLLMPSASNSMTACWI